MEDNTGPRVITETRRKSMEDNTGPRVITETRRKSMEDNTEFRPQSCRSPHSAPSFFRRARPRTPHEMINLHVGVAISSQSVPGQNIVLVRPRTLGQANPKEHNGPVPMEGDEEIVEEEAICKDCFHKLKEENILKTECKCGNALIHEECAAEWSRTRGNNNCDYCEQEVQTFPVTLVRGLSSSTQVVGKEKSKKSSLFSRLMRKA